MEPTHMIDSKESQLGLMMKL